MKQKILNIFFVTMLIVVTLFAVGKALTNPAFVLWLFLTP